MAQNNLLKTFLTEEDFDFLEKDNKINDEKFQEFHKKMFEEMLDQELFLACKILDKKGQRPGVGEFEKEVSDLTTEIMKTKTDLLGDYLKK